MFSAIVINFGRDEGLKKMKPQKSLAVLLLLFPILASFFVADHGVCAAALVGGWQPIKNLNDRDVQEIAKFAVTAHNKEAKTDLKYQSVVRGETQVVAGTNYRLLIAAKDGKVSNKYQAIVWDKPWEKFRNLTSFKQV